MNSNINNINLKEECRSYMMETGLPFNGELITDGKIHRYSTSGDKNKKNEWYVAYEGISSRGNLYLNVVFGSWREGIKHEYKSFDHDTHISSDERTELMEVAQLNKINAEKEIILEHDNAAQKAKEIWDNAAKNPPSDEYLAYTRTKRISPTNGIRFSRTKAGEPCIAIPLYNSQGEIRSLQFITKDSKRFLSGGEKKGNYHLIGESEKADVFFIGEGYATCVTIYEAIKMPTIVAFDAGNIQAVIESVSRLYPNAHFIIAADNDATGIKKANEASAKFKCSVVVPDFRGSKQDNDTDFNDLARALDIEAVRDQLIQAYAKSEVGQRLARNLFLGEPCKDFRIINLPEQLREYIASIQKTTNAHPLMISASVIAMLAAYLNTKICIPEGEYFQTLYPNLWLLCIAKSGQFKTTALNKGASLAYKQQAAVFEAIKEIRFNLDNQDASDVEKCVLQKSRENIVLPTKITAEALLEHLAQGHKGVIYASEFGGWLQNLEKTHNNDFKAIMTELYDVPGFYRYKTKTQGDCILETPCISICGVSTLAWLHPNIKQTDVTSGFFARFLILTPPLDDKIPPALPPKQISSHENKEAPFKQHLDYILACVGDGIKMTLNDSAQKMFHSYHVYIHCIPQICSDTVAELIQPYIKRWSPYLLKIAMIMQLLNDPSSNEITEKAIFQAFQIIKHAIRSTIWLFERDLGESAYEKKCRVLLEWIRIKGGKIKRHTVLISKQLKGGAAEYDPVLKDLIERGQLTYHATGKKNEAEYRIVENS